jgi:sphingoid base N-palmitoyltransferase
MLSLSCYWSLLFTVFEDVKRKDFLEMAIHHIVTITLLVLSWTCNLIRMGSLVLILHDVADIFLESAKMTKYIRWQRTCDVLFVIFTIIWIVTRLGIYPLWILRRYNVNRKNHEFLNLDQSIISLKYWK